MDILIRPQDENNRILVENVHPPGWKNPEPARRYNLVVVGAGTAGLVTAAGAAGLGAKVALVERHLLGGDCLNVGCVPSKGLIRAGRAAFDAANADAFGIQSRVDSIDFSKAMERMRALRAGISAHDAASRFRDTLGVDVFFGSAQFLGSDALEVNGRRLNFKRAAICTGARAAVPDIPGMAEAGCLTNETVFELTELPKRLAVIGGGPIGCELSQAFARMGSRVTLLHHGSHLLPREDVDAAGIIQKAFARERVEVLLGAKIAQAGRSGSGKFLVVHAAGKSRKIEFDEILAGVGRAPNIEGLELERAGIAYDARNGVTVDDLLRTSNPRVYAAGDVCSAYKFTHAADAQARIVIANALFKARQRVSALVIPWCTYTDPEVAHVGLYEKEAADKGLDVATITVPLADVDRAVLDDETEGFARVHLKKGGDRILGATIVARHAGDMINEVTLAMTSGLGLSSIGKTIHPYPTQAEAVRKLADAYNRTRLTPFVKKLFTSWLAWQRS